ncbi:MAG: hypothetical protein JEY97_10040 [Bacteroidales bacterium]|nr:hypothetical protein [Bacteroidales bacterium]
MKNYLKILTILTFVFISSCGVTYKNVNSIKTVSYKERRKFLIKEMEKLEKDHFPVDKTKEFISALKYKRNKFSLDKFSLLPNLIKNLIRKFIKYEKKKFNYVIDVHSSYIKYIEHLQNTYGIPNHWIEEFCPKFFDQKELDYRISKIVTLNENSIRQKKLKELISFEKNIAKFVYVNPGGVLLIYSFHAAFKEKLSHDKIFEDLKCLCEEYKKMGVDVKSKDYVITFGWLDYDYEPDLWSRSGDLYNAVWRASVGDTYAWINEEFFNYLLEEGYVFTSNGIVWALQQAKKNRDFRMVERMAEYGNLYESLYEELKNIKEIEYFKTLVNNKNHIDFQVKYCFDEKIKTLIINKYSLKKLPPIEGWEWKRFPKNKYVYCDNYSQSYNAKIITDDNIPGNSNNPELYYLKQDAVLGENDLMLEKEEKSENYEIRKIKLRIEAPFVQLKKTYVFGL